MHFRLQHLIGLCHSLGQLCMIRTKVMQKVSRGPKTQVSQPSHDSFSAVYQGVKTALAEKACQDGGAHNVRKSLNYLKTNYYRYRSAETDLVLLKFALDWNLTPHIYVNNKVTRIQACANAGQKSKLQATVELMPGRHHHIVWPALQFQGLQAGIVDLDI